MGNRCSFAYKYPHLISSVRIATFQLPRYGNSYHVSDSFITHDSISVIMRSFLL